MQGLKEIPPLEVAVVAECMGIGASGKPASRSDAEDLEKLGSAYAGHVRDRGIAAAYCDAVANLRFTDWVDLGTRGMSAVVNCMEARATDVEVQAYGCRAIWNINADQTANPLKPIPIPPNAADLVTRAWAVLQGNHVGNLKAFAVGAIGSLSSPFTIPKHSTRGLVGSHPRVSCG